MLVLLLVIGETTVMPVVDVHRFARAGSSRWRVMLLRSSYVADSRCLMGLPPMKMSERKERPTVQSAKVG